MASAGVDDLDLDGNWVVDEPATTGAAGNSAPKAAGGKKRKRKGAPADGSSVGAVTSLISSVLEDEGSGEKKGAKKKRRKKLANEVADSNQFGSDVLKEACARLVSAWAAEGKASSSTPLEMKELVPLPEWFVPCPLAVTLAALPQKCAGEFAPGVLRAIHKKELPAPRPKSASVVVLCTSTERVFAAIEEMRTAWGTKPLALATFGGGRRKDQIARQAKALKVGCLLAVGTPGRVLRLVEEGHIIPGSVDLFVVDQARDRKQRDVLTLPDTRRDFFCLLRQHLMAGLADPEGHRLLLCGRTAADSA